MFPECFHVYKILENIYGSKTETTDGLRWQKEGGMKHTGARGNVWGDKNVLYLDCSGGFTFAPPIVPLKWTRFIVGR